MHQKNKPENIIEKENIFLTLVLIQLLLISIPLYVLIYKGFGDLLIRKRKNEYRKEKQEEDPYISYK